MTPAQQQLAWERELDTLTAVLRGTLRSVAEPENIDRDARQAATGILLLTTLPDGSFKEAARHLRMDLKRRGLLE